MNRNTKNIIINTMINALRNNNYIEHDEMACHEFDVFERKPNGSYGAQEGEHDDILITRCIGLYVAQQEPTAVITYTRHNNIINEASF